MKKWKRRFRDYLQQEIAPEDFFRCQRQFMKEVWQVSAPEHMSEEDMQINHKGGA